MSVEPVRLDPAAPPTPAGAAAGGARVRVFARTDVGRTREHNEDAYLVADLAAAHPLAFDRADAAPHEFDGAAGALFLVADGLGGAAAGEVASHLATEAAFQAMRAALPDAADDPTRFATALRDAVLAANAAIHRTAAERADLRGMATTLTAAALRVDTLYLAQVGDSRAYLVRGGEARQLTKDQSLVQRLVDAGELTPEQAETSARRNIILQALGADRTVKVDVTHQPLRQGDLLLLCSDGLSGQLRASELADAAHTAPELDALCQALIDRANDTGGPDNITVVAARFDGPALGAPTPDDDRVGHQKFAVLPTPATTQAIVADVLAGAAAARGEPGETSGEPGATVAGPRAGGDALGAAGAASIGGAAADPDGDQDTDDPALAERRGRARLVYLVLGILAASVAAFYLWRLLTE
jgi:protein phosphatase